MIGNSIIVMTVIDLIIISATVIALWHFYQNKQLLKHLHVFSGLAMVLSGLLIIASLYIADIIAMHLLPKIMPHENAMDFMQTLHFNYSWILFTCGIGLIVISIIYLNRIIFPKILLLENELKKLASTDSLTQAYNRTKFDEIISREMERAIRYNSLLSIIMFDIDHFKKVNDTYGHLAGDYVLKTAADLTREGIRGIDYLVRWGGEEFVILLPETGLEKAEALAERIKEKIGSYHFDKVGTVTVSFGVTQFRNEDSEDIFIKRADDSLYSAKVNGRNRVEVGV
jgi:diguanylate cyclase (GGDEF)-like protein